MIKKVFYRNNLKIYIPYLHPEDNEKHYYCPDVLLYEDQTFNVLHTIVEIKPKIFLTEDSLYGEITRRKIEQLKTFGIINNYNIQIVTEEGLGEYIEKAKEVHQDKIIKESKV